MVAKKQRIRTDQVAEYPEGHWSNCLREMNNRQRDAACCGSR